MEATRYWIEINLDPSENFEMAEIRAVAAGLSYKGHWAQRHLLFSLMSKIGTDPTREATETIKLLRGHLMIEVLPNEVRELLADNQPPIHRARPPIAWYPEGAKAAYLKLLDIEDNLSGETYELVHLYLLKVAEAQANHNITMDRHETLRWIVDHWHLGDVGCAQALDRQRPGQGQPQGSGGPSFEPTTRGRRDILANTLFPRRPSRAFEERHSVHQVVPETPSSPTPTPPIRERSIPQPEPQPHSPEPTKATQQDPLPLSAPTSSVSHDAVQTERSEEAVQITMSIEKEPEAFQPKAPTTPHDLAALADLRAAVAKLRGPLL